VVVHFEVIFLKNSIRCLAGQSQAGSLVEDAMALVAEAQ
jgi:hypothetical protein